LIDRKNIFIPTSYPPRFTLGWEKEEIDSYDVYLSLIPPRERGKNIFIYSSNLSEPLNWNQKPRWN